MRLRGVQEHRLLVGRQRGAGLAADQRRQRGRRHGQHDAPGFVARQAVGHRRKALGQHGQGIVDEACVGREHHHVTGHRQRDGEIAIRRQLRREWRARRLRRAVARTDGTLPQRGAGRPGARRHRQALVGAGLVVHIVGLRLGLVRADDLAEQRAQRRLDGLGLLRRREPRHEQRRHQRRLAVPAGRSGPGEGIAHTRGRVGHLLGLARRAAQQRAGSLPVDRQRGAGGRVGRQRVPEGGAVPLAGQAVRVDQRGALPAVAADTGAEIEAQRLDAGEELLVAERQIVGTHQHVMAGRLGRRQRERLALHVALPGVVRQQRGERLGLCRQRLALLVEQDARLGQRDQPVALAGDQDRARAAQLERIHRRARIAQRVRHLGELRIAGGHGADRLQRLGQPVALHGQHPVAQLVVRAAPQHHAGGLIEHMLEDGLGQVELLLVRQAPQCAGHRQAVFVALVVGDEILGQHIAQQRHAQHIARQLRQALAVDQGIGQGQVQPDLARAQCMRAAERMPDQLDDGSRTDHQRGRADGDFLACQFHGGMLRQDSGKTGASPAKQRAVRSFRIGRS